MKTPFSEQDKPEYQTNQTMVDKPVQYAEQVAALQTEAKEIDEAIAAGRNVIAGLEQVVESLESARKWGIWDMLGGGLLSTAVKHSRIDKARQGIDNVQRLMRHFTRELADVRSQVELRIDISEFESFADYLFDGFIVDWIVQSKINDALSRAHQARATVSQAVRELEALKRTTQRKQNDAAYHL